MKKKNLKSLRLGKKKVSNFSAKGGVEITQTMQIYCITNPLPAPSPSANSCFLSCNPVPEETRNSCYFSCPGNDMPSCHWTECCA